MKSVMTRRDFPGNAKRARKHRVDGKHGFVQTFYQEGIPLEKPARGFQCQRIEMVRVDGCHGIQDGHCRIRFPQIEEALCPKQPHARVVGIRGI